MAERLEEDDSRLDDLLDSALKDFSENSKRDKNENDAEKKTSIGTSPIVTDTKEMQDFFVEEAKMLADRMNTLFSGNEASKTNEPILSQNPEQILAGFKKMAEAAALTLQGDNNASDEEVAKYSDSIAQALRGLQEGSDNLSAPINDGDVSNMFNSLNFDNCNTDDGNAFLPFMEGMMQSLLSAEVLLPSIKELLEKYPKYLEENADKLSSEDIERYTKQLNLYKTIEGHLLNENTNDTAKEKRDKFRLVLDSMRKLQEYGQLPQEILAETAGDLSMFDPATSDAMAGNPQCPVM